MRRRLSDLLLRRASESRPGADGLDDYYVIGPDGLVIGRIFKASRFPNVPWQWTLAYGQNDDRSPRPGYEPTREAAMAAFKKSRRRPHAKAAAPAKATARRRGPTL
jgi:hypothetical protein